MSGSICIAVVVRVSVGVGVFSEQAVVMVEGVGLAGRVELLSTVCTCTRVRCLGVE